MTYHAGIGIGLATLVGMPERPRDPHVTCDGCGEVRDGMKPSGEPYAWLVNRKAPPGWRLDRRETIDGILVRFDYCAACKGAWCWGERGVT